MSHLILPPPPDVPAEVDLLLSELVAGQKVIELLHRSVDDLRDTEVDVHLSDHPLVPGQAPLLVVEV